MATITLRNVKGSPLTHTEVDDNFSNLNTDKAELTDLSITTNAAGSAALTYSNTTGVFTYTPPDLSPYLTASDLGNYATVDDATALSIALG